MGRRRRWVGQVAGTRAGALPEAIAALSRTLSAGPSPETFRRAKFDFPEAAPPLWRLLFYVLSPLSEDDIAASLTPEARVRLVKSAMRAQGYPRLAFSRLPEDGSQGSRELLLALSWLLARGPLLERLLARTRVRLGDEMPVCECEDLPCGRASPGPPTLCKDTEGCVDVRHVQWLMGKLRFRWRNLICSHQAQCALLSKIHEYTLGCHSDQSLNHLSAAETELLRDPEGGQQLLQMLEFENMRLEAALEWRRLEQVFWQWMDTVLGACPPDFPHAGSQSTFLPSIPDPGAGELDLVARELQALQVELREAVEVRRAAWEAQVRGLRPERSAEMRALKEAVGRELATLQQAWEREGGPVRPHRPHRLVRSEAGALPGQGLWAAEAIGALRNKEACLEAVLCWLQGQCQQELARLAGALPGVIWIPPHGR
ncbi:tubulin epsilon and delta complex protein 1 [Trichechus inunguis]|uniref:Tubulin epsilon and delta complex protein 1 n=1 Tax=Trichechus manatus latirostris TaxID=127582 RepID=A0A2Y9R6U0_TRIMA|nr:tubulin epsilon and delta complex protein 1 [Trichechus manatus latirostris]